MTPGGAEDDRRAEAEPPARTVALAEKMLEEVRSELERADAKASLLIGSLGIAFSVILGGMLGGDFKLGSLGPVAQVFWIIGGLAAIGSVLASALAVWPRLSKAPKSGVITFWGHVEGFGSTEELATALAAQGLHDPQRTFQQLLVLSAVVRTKYRWIRWSMLLASGGLLLLGAAFLIAA